MSGHVHVMHDQTELVLFLILSKWGHYNIWPEPGDMVQYIPTKIVLNLRGNTAVGSSGPTHDAPTLPAV